MIDTDKYEGLSEVIDRIINSDEIGVDDLLADSMVIKDGINELLAEVKRLRKQVSKAKEWVRSYFINMSGDFNSLEDKVVYDDFTQQMGMKKND